MKKRNNKIYNKKYKIKDKKKNKEIKINRVIKFKKKVISLDVKKVSKLGKYSGLMFRKKGSKNLLFEFESEFPTIHSIFVFFDFLAVWLDENNEVQDYFVVKPFSLSARPKRPSAKLIEIPINSENKKIIELFVGKRKDLNR